MLKFTKKIKYLFIVLITNILVFTVFAREPKTAVYIYNDEGASQDAAFQAASTLKSFLSSKYEIKYINAADILTNNWTTDAALFVMPGGADSPYVKKLNGLGNKKIQDFVKKGGSYLGLCAGAYYAASYIEFDKGGELQVLGDRELSFFGGKAIGPILAKYDYKSNSGSRAARIRLNLEEVTNTVVYYNGGGYFENADDYPNTTIIGFYENNLPAIIHISYGNPNVILSGVHFEYNPYLIPDYDFYLKSILPTLKINDTSRRILVQEMIKRLELNKGSSRREF